MLTHHGIEVVELMPNRVLFTPEEQTLPTMMLDGGTGVRTAKTATRQPRRVRNIEFVAFDLGAAYLIREMLERRIGRQRPAWFPSWQRDLTLAASASAGASTIQVRECGYATNIFPSGAARRHIALRSAAGVMQARLVTNATTNGTTETLTLAVPLAVSIDTTWLAMFLRLTRLERDDVTYAWEGGYACDGRAALRLELPIRDLSTEVPS